jgi:hypothetical protein
MVKGKRGRPKKVETNDELVEQKMAETKLPEPIPNEPEMVMDEVREEIKLPEPTKFEVNLEEEGEGTLVTTLMRIIDHNGISREEGESFRIEDKGILKQLRTKEMVK